MVEKMKYINVTGPCEEIDRVTEKYLSKYQIQLEYAVKELPGNKALQGFSGSNPYSERLHKAEALIKAGGADMERLSSCPPEAEGMSREDAFGIIDSAFEYMDGVTNDLQRLEAERDACLRAAAVIEPFSEIEFNVSDLKSFEFLRYQFGKMPISSFKQFEAFLYDNPEILFVNGKNDGESLWGVYFTTSGAYSGVDSIFSSLHFEKLDFPLEMNGEPLEGTPTALCAFFKSKAGELEHTIAALTSSLFSEADSDESVEFSIKGVCLAYRRTLSLSQSFDARKYAALTANGFFIFVGWMAESDARKLSNELENDETVTLIVEDNNDAIVSKPPVKLRNFRLFRPFEFFVKMYGLPSYDELDPTPFVALTYTLLFGIMFADLGQGAVLALLGLYLAKKKKMGLGPVLTVIGCSSAVFGFLFGSFFGFEFESLLFHPAKPENINSTLFYALGLGVALILVSMSFSLINAAKKGRLRDVLFSHNGVAGLVFYAGVLVIAVLMLTGAGVPSYLYIICVAAPLLLIAAKEPLMDIMRGKKPSIRGSVPLYLFESVIGLFEVLLSFFTNTVSYVRVGAFALSHASIMSVVWMLSKNSAGSNNIIVIILGNILAMALEGLIAGIQVLRLEFYEMFSRFYEGDGREFEPYKRNAA